MKNIKRCREDRRDSQDEKRQKGTIAEKSKNVEKKYEDVVSLSLEDLKLMSVSTSKVSKRFRSNGELVPSRDEYDPFRDTKAMDGVVYYRNKKTDDYVDIYFFCKYTKQPGGYQQSINHEIKVTKDCIDNNKDEHVVVIFMLEGKFWDSNPSLIEKAGFDNKKTFYAKTETMEEVITSILVDKGLI